jgi:predicted nucleic acid-binding protein
MSGSVVLDNTALAALAGPKGPDKETVRAALTAALRRQSDVVVPSVVLAEMYRGRHHNQVVDACLSRETGLRIRDTDRPLARLVGGVLAGAGVGSEYMVDAHVVAAAVESGGGVCLTSDPEDLTALSAAYPHVTVVNINA